MVSPCQIQQGATIVEIGLATLVACVPMHFSTEMYSKKNKQKKHIIQKIKGCYENLKNTSKPA